MKIRGIKSPIQVKQPQNVGLGELLPLLQDLATKHQDILRMHGEFKQLHGDVMGKIASIKQGPPGRDGIGVAGRDGISPEIDYAHIIREVVKMIPRAKDGKDGKPGEKLTPDEVIKALFSPERMDLQQIIDMRLDPHVQNLRRLVMRGGGDTVVAGSGVTITQSAGVKTISASGISRLTATGTVNGSNTAFTFASKPTYIVSDGAWYIENAGWTWNSGTLTATMSVAPQTNIFGIA